MLYKDSNYVMQWKDEEMKQFAAVYTTYACRFIEKQLDLSKRVTYDITSTGVCNPLSKEIHNCTTDTCNCPEFTSYQLPCRHMLLLRRHYSVDLVGHIVDRWTTLNVPNSNIRTDLKNARLSLASLKEEKVLSGVKIMEGNRPGRSKIPSKQVRFEKNNNIKALKSSLKRKEFEASSPALINEKEPQKKKRRVATAQVSNSTIVLKKENLAISKKKNF